MADAIFLRAAEVTSDPLLRRLVPGAREFDELRTPNLFRRRGADLLKLRSTRSKVLSTRAPFPAAMGSTTCPSKENRPSSARLCMWRKKAAAGHVSRFIAMCR